MYEYRATVDNVVDGDTVDMDFIDLGFGVVRMGIPPARGDKGDPFRFRLASINAFEKTLRGGTTPAQKILGIEATQWLRALVEGHKVRVKTVKAGKRGNLGRYLAYLFIDGPDDEKLDPLDGSICINRMLLDKGYAVVSKYDDGAVYDGLGYPREED